MCSVSLMKYGRLKAEHKLIKMLATKQVVNSDGEEQCDSPGPSAKFETYNLIDDDTGNVIVAFNVAQVTQ